MQIDLERPTAQIIPFVARQTVANRLTIVDRMQAMEWDVAHSEALGTRLEIHDRQRSDAPEVADYIGIYRAGEGWALWGLARQGKVIKVWNGPTGADLGCFLAMRDALAAVARESVEPGRRRKS